MTMRSTLWTAVEVNERPLDELINAISTVQKNKSVYDEDEEYSYIIQSVNRRKDGIVGTLYKYRKEKTVPSINPSTGQVSTESVHNFPVADYAFFGISLSEMVIEEKRPHLGQRLVLRVIEKLAAKALMQKYEMEFKTDIPLVKEFIEGLNILEAVRFTRIGINPSPDDEYLKLFEEFEADVKASSIELRNKKRGLNKKSKIISGGIKLANENKAEIHMEGADSNGEPQVLDTSEAKAKVREKIDYKPDERDSTIPELIKRKLGLK